MDKGRHEVSELLCEVLQRCLLGQEDAYKIIVRRFREQALELAYSIVRDEHLAEDAVQSAFLSAFCRLKDLREPRAFPGWFRQIVRTHANRIVRRRKEKPYGSIGEERANQASLVKCIELKELRALVRDTLAQLPKVERETAELFYLDERNHIDVANLLGVPRGTVKRRLHDARQRLRNMLLGYVTTGETKNKIKGKSNRKLPL